MFYINNVGRSSFMPMEIVDLSGVIQICNKIFDTPVLIFDALSESPSSINIKF